MKNKLLLGATILGMMFITACSDNENIVNKKDLDIIEQNNVINADNNEMPEEDIEGILDVETTKQENDNGTIIAQENIKNEQNVTHIENINVKKENNIVNLSNEDILGHWKIKKAVYKDSGLEFSLRELYRVGNLEAWGVDFRRDGTTDEIMGIMSDENVKELYRINDGIIKVWINGNLVREYECIREDKTIYLRSLREDYGTQPYYLYFEIEYDEELEPRWWHQKERIVKKDGKYGLLAENGDILLRCIYDGIQPLPGGFYGVEHADKYALWLPSREQLEFKYDVLQETEGEHWGHRLFIVKYNGRYGVVNYDGNDVIQCKYEYIENVKDAIYIAKQDGKYGVITVAQELIPFEYEELRVGDIYRWDGDVTLVAKLSGKYGIIDKEGKEIVPYEYEDIKESNFGIELPQHYKIKKNNKWGMLNIANQQIVVPIEYDEIEENEGVICKVRSGDKWGIINLETHVQIFPCKYKEIELMYVENWNEYAPPYICKVTENGRMWGIVDWKGTIISECMYEEIKNASHWMDYYFMTKHNSKWGVLDSSGKKIIDFKYDDIEFYSENEVDVYRYFVKKDGKYGLINETGKELVKCKYATKEEVKNTFEKP